MKEVKRTPVPLPGTKKTSKTKSTPSKAPLSQEFISSDDDDATTQNAPTKTMIAVHPPNGTGSAKKKTNSKAKDSAPAKPATGKTQQPKKPQPKQIVQQDASDFSDSEQTDDNDSHPTRDVQTTLPTRNKNQGESNSSSDSDSDSSSDASDSEDDSQAKPTPVQPQKETPRKSTYATQSRPASAFVPPKGFNVVPVNDKTISKAAHTFQDIKGKELWHITAPAGVSLKNLKELALKQALDGGVVLEHQGSGYGFVKEDRGQGGEREVLVPAKNAYRTAPSHISRTLHLQAVVKLPQLETDVAQANTSEASQSITRSTIRAPRPQVKGLKMRFLPTGSGDVRGAVLGDSESEEDEEQDASNELRVPSKKEKRRHSGANGQADVEVPAKKHKKNRTPEELKRREEKKAKKNKQKA